jgi:hypothetical protein
MKTSVMMTTALLLAAVATQAQVTPARVADDARVIDRVAEASKRDLPRDLLRRIIDEDIELLRGPRPDGAYQYAGYERFESGRVNESFSIDPEKADKLAKLEVKADLAYRLVISSPARRMLVTKNRRVWLDSAQIEYLPQGSRTMKTQSIKLGVWIDPGATRAIDLDDIARQATVRLFVHADPDSSYGNIDLTLLQARVFDDPNSPYADAVSSLKAIRKALDHDDIASMRAMAQRVEQDVRGTTTAPAAVTTGMGAVTGAQASVDVAAPRADSDTYGELQAIEDLLTGNDSERRQGLDRLHQLVRKLRHP